MSNVWDIITHWWVNWCVDTNNENWAYIKNNKKFGRELALMLRSDGLIFDNKGNKITKLK